MTSGKRPSGRPRGSSRYKQTDPGLLEKVADKLLDDPGLSTRAAIIRVLGGVKDEEDAAYPSGQHHGR